MATITLPPLVALGHGRVVSAPPEDLFTGVTYSGRKQPNALSDYARYILAARRIEVIGVTGSVGKTSAKEAIAAVLAERYPVFKNHGNYNGRYGYPSRGRLSQASDLLCLKWLLTASTRFAILRRSRIPAWVW
jgi:hypothetical protein